MDNKEIWQLLDSSNLGGIETHVMELTAALCRKGLKTRIVFLKNHGEHPILPLLRENRLPYKILKGSLIDLIREIALWRPKLMHTHGYKAGIIGRFAGITTHIPVISTFHSGEPGIGKVRLYNQLDRKTAFLAREIIAVNTQIAAHLPDRTHVINNFVEVFGKSKKLVKNPAFVGRLSYEKGPDIFCKLANLIPMEQFTIYGMTHEEGAKKHLSNSRICWSKNFYERSLAGNWNFMHHFSPRRAPVSSARSDESWNTSPGVRSWRINHFDRSREKWMDSRTWRYRRICTKTQTLEQIKLSTNSKDVG